MARLDTPGAWRASANANVIRLAMSQALAVANSTVIFATGAIIGATLAPNAALATLPISILVVGMSACTLPAGAVARRWGRRAAFLAGTGCGVVAGLLAALAICLGAFWLFCVATFFGGAYAPTLTATAQIIGLSPTAAMKARAAGVGSQRARTAQQIGAGGKTSSGSVSKLRTNPALLA